MMTKTVSENLDLVLNYRSINLIGAPVSLNGVIANYWPRSIRYTSAAKTYNVADSTVSYDTYTTAASGIYNTFASLIPSLTSTNYITVSGSSFTIVSAGVYAIVVKSTLLPATTNGKYYFLGIGYTDTNGSTNIASASRSGFTTGPTDGNFSCSVTRYLPAGAIVGAVFQSSDATQVTSCEVYFTKLS